MELANDADFHSAVRDAAGAFVMFTAPWCAACKEMKPKVVELVASLADAKLCFVNTTLLTELTLELGITRLPGFLLYKNGESVSRAVGPSFQELAVLARATFGNAAAKSDDGSETAPAAGMSVDSTDSESPAVATVTPAIQATAPASPASRARALDSSLGALNVPVFPGGLPCKVTPQYSSALDVALGINSVILSLYGEHVTLDGKGVNYAAMMASPAFAEYVQTTAQLQFVTLDALAPQELKAFVLNIYNALVIHAIAVRGAADTTIPGALTAFFRSHSYNIGGDLFTLDDLEHGILRGNKIHPTTQKRFFEAGDARARLASTDPDPRIHFALVCGAKGCPPIRLYTPSNVDIALDMATAAFCDENVAIDEGTRTVTLSRIFWWYSSDFGADTPSVLRWILPRLPASKQAALQACIAGSAEATVIYSTYDWGVNTT